MIRVAICDDDEKYMKSIIKPALLTIEQKLKTYVRPLFFTTGNSLVQTVKSGEMFDLILLDIDMPGLNGKEIAKQLREIDSNFFLVFISSYEKEVFDTIKYKINAFVPKSASKEKLLSELNRVIKEFIEYKPEFEYFHIYKDGIVIHVKYNVDNIYGFYFMDKFCYIKLNSEDVIIQETVFKRLIDRFCEKGFIECKRNYLVNTTKIKTIESDHIVLCNDDIVPLSKRKRNLVLSEFTKYVMSTRRR